MQNETQHIIDTIVIGAGLTGLTTAHTLRKHGKEVVVLEKTNRIGGQIQTHRQDGFTFESGPNTGVVSYPEVAELFKDLEKEGCTLEEAHNEAKQRWIWKGKKFYALPSNLITAIRTPLFSWTDKFGILLEPFRAKGTNPNEDVASMVVRRLGKSYLNFAVDPFISGVYAGDPHSLITRYALPKLYNLEQNYGSFIRGGIAKGRERKTERDRLATKKVFSAEGGLQRLIDTLGRSVGETNIVLGAQDLHLQPTEQGWEAEYAQADGTVCRVVAQQVVTTVGAYALPSLLPFAPKGLIDAITSLRYAPVVQVSVGFGDVNGQRNKAFGGLVPSCENRRILGVLFPASCFEGRAPVQGDLFSVFVGGIKHPEVMDMSDVELTQLVLAELRQMLHLSADLQPTLLRIFRHRHAIPQYEVSSGERFEAISTLQGQYKGLIVGGNLRNGIGMADRIKQGTAIIPQELANF